MTGSPSPIRPPTPINEIDRLATLRELCLLDTPADAVLDGLTDLASRVFHAPIALVTLVDERRQWFKSKVGLAVQETPREQAFCAHAISLPGALVVLDTHRDERFATNPLVLGAPFIRFYAGAPVVTREGMALGTLCVIDTEPRKRFDAEQENLLRCMADLVTMRIESLRLMGFVDPLTRLPNRYRFVEDLRLWMADDGRPLERMAAVVVDVCGAEYFREMIKALGWDYAEGFVIAARDRLAASIAVSPLYRIDTTLFGFVMEAAGKDELASRLRGVSAAFTRPIEHQAIPHLASISIGSMRMKAHDAPGEILRSLISAADTARQQGRGFIAYKKRHDQTQRRAFGILAALPDALVSTDQFHLVYQPRVDLSRGRCVGVEALLRWNHPTIGNIPPSHFIPLAEKTALMYRITQWVFRAGFAQAAHWQRSGVVDHLSLNASAGDLERPEFTDLLVTLTREYGVEPGGIEIEVTENAISQHPERMTKVLEHIRALGFALAIDDFGTGYSNLNYLKRVPATALKIDQSFIRSLLTDQRDSAIVPSMIHLGHDIGQRVVAEGIESEQVFDVLAHLGCDEGQGFWIAEPMRAEEAEQWLQRCRTTRMHFTRDDDGFAGPPTPLYRPRRETI